ncbi:cyclodeaminase/cyclohydrolase family protein [bacterium]|nr:cyclodeaminase/cyclohydrolase family protein [bacterium]
MILKQAVENFLDDLSSKSPTPGGGSVAALSGATAAALVSMVCNLSIGKKSCESNKDELEQILAHSEKLRELFSELIDQDVEAFDDVMNAFRMSKNDDEEKLLRNEALNHSLQKATYVPIRTMEHGAEILTLAHRVAQICNRNVISDAGVAAIMAESAVHSAYFNVAINLENIDEQEFVDRIENKTEQIMDDIEGLADETIEIVEDIIYGE